MACRQRVCAQWRAHPSHIKVAPAGRWPVGWPGPMGTQQQAQKTVQPLPPPPFMTFLQNFLASWQVRLHVDETAYKKSRETSTALRKSHQILLIGLLRSSTEWNLNSSSGLSHLRRSKYLKMWKTVWIRIINIRKFHNC